MPTKEPRCEASESDAYAAYLERLQRTPRVLPAYLNRPSDVALQAVVTVVATLLFWAIAWQVVVRLATAPAAWPLWVWPGLVLFVFVGPAVLLLVMLLKARERAIARRGAIAEGIVVEVDSIRGSIHYRYAVADREYPGACRNERLAAQIDSGTRVFVCYDALRPSRSVFYDVVRLGIEDEDGSPSVRLARHLAENERRIRNQMLWILGIPAIAVTLVLVSIALKSEKNAQAARSRTETVDTTRPETARVWSVPGCRCASAGESVALSIEDTPYDMHYWQLQVTPASGPGVNTAMHPLASLSNSTPPYLDRQVPKRMRLGIACDGGVVMFASGLRASGWSAQGHSAWELTLPEKLDEPADGTGIECFALASAKGVATLRLASGKHISVVIADGNSKPATVPSTAKRIDL